MHDYPSGMDGNFKVAGGRVNSSKTKIATANLKTPLCSDAVT